MNRSEPKIRVVHYCNQLSIGGTERTMEIFCKYLDRSRFDVFAVSRVHRVPLTRRFRVAVGAAIGHAGSKGKRQLWKAMNARRPNFEQLLGGDHLFFANSDDDLRRILLKLDPDILHVHYSGAPEPPTSDERVMSRIRVTVTTNPFERENTSPAHAHAKKILFVSRWLLENKALWAKNDLRSDVLYNPIEVPCSSASLRDRLGIPPGAFVVGRVGRPDPGIHDPIALRAFRRIDDENTYFLALSPPENMVRQARGLSLRHFISVPGSTDDVFLSSFYNAIDVLAHSRRDGETFGCNIAEAMIHGKPVVSHLTSFMNAQTEVIGDAGIICGQDDWESYAKALQRLKAEPLFRAEMGARAQRRAIELFEARTVTRKLERIYFDLLGSARSS